MSELAVLPVTPERWDDLARLFGPNGAYSNCWCTFFRQTGASFGEGCRDGGARNRAMMRALVRDGEVPGLLAYRGDAPVGWVSVGPRPQFGRYLRSPITRLDPDARDDAGTWSIVCLFVPRAERRRGVARALVHGAVAWARERGAARLEGYPVDTGGGRRPSNELYVGTVDLFAAAGFVETARRIPTRPVMEVALG